MLTYLLIKILSSLSDDINSDEKDAIIYCLKCNHKKIALVTEYEVFLFWKYSVAYVCTIVHNNI